MYHNLIRSRWVKLFDKLGEEFLQYTKLRYIRIGRVFRYSPYNKEIMSTPSTLPLLWNLQTLYFRSFHGDPQIVLPYEIWEMPQLRHIKIKLVVLPDPMDDQDNTTVLENLQKLSTVHNFRCTDEVVERIPNLKKLEVCYFANLEEWSYYCLHNLVRLHKLESLNFRAQDLLLESITFPTSLKKLVLSDCKIPWEGMTIIGLLPNLEVLKLYDDAFEGSEWNPIEGEFLRLKALFIWSCEVVWWGAEDIHFPNLEVLSLKFVSKLKEIPSSIEDITMLNSIGVRLCGAPVKNSAQRILKE
ncbi:UNVERIFIED_CONTAM: hypothetical protein Slati_2102000 [Sesamum latifolium]|uniref:Disease resistance protein n=1 Tax=Sesamum latifolium TaxID=2727402 RepID=A0AAW2WQU9_9LAMI